MKKLVSLLLVLALCLGLGTTALAADLVELNIAYMPNYASLWTVVTGIQNGYFEEEGLKVNLVEFADGPTIIAAMESGTIDMGYIGPGAHKLCINGRAQIFAMSHVGNADAVIASKKAGINTAADLKGKKVGYSSGTSSEMILKYALEDAGLAWSDIVAYEMDASALVTAMLSGSIDACACWSPSTATIIENSDGDAFSLCGNVDFADRSVSMASWIVLSGYYEKNAETVNKFTRGLYKAMDFASKEENIAQVAQWVADKCAISYDASYAQRGDGKWISSDELKALLADGTVENYYKVQQDAFITSGDVAAPVPVADYVLFDNMNKAGE